MAHNPKPCRIWWSARTQLWHGIAFGFQSNGHTVASVYANLAAMHRQWVDGCARRGLPPHSTTVPTTYTPLIEFRDPAECSGAVWSKPHGL